MACGGCGFGRPALGLSYHTARGALGDSPPPGVMLPPGMDAAPPASETPPPPVQKGAAGALLALGAVGGIMYLLLRSATR